MPSHADQTVSYTHLDVYKRQIQPFIQPFITIKFLQILKLIKGWSNKARRLLFHNFS